MKHLHIKRRAVMLLLGISLFSVARLCAAFPTATYFPLPDGATWDYTDSYSSQYTAWISSGTYPVNGVATKRMYDVNGESYYYTNDANGIRLHRLGLSFASATATFSPPIPMVKVDANIGDRLNSAGTATVYVPGAGSYPINYTSSGTIVAAERITVPAGTFDTIRFVLTFRLYGTINGQYVDETATSTLWLAPGVGIVQDDEAQYGKLRLVSTNIASVLPAVSINYPADGALVTRNFSVRFALSNWAITPSGNHLHWFLDGIDQGPRYDTSPIPVKGLADGPHTITLRLANPDHSFNGSEDSVSFVFEKRSSAISTIINTLLLSD